VVGTGNANESGGPSSSQILSSTSVTVVAATNVVPATVAIGKGGGGISVPSAEAVGLVAPGKVGNPVEEKGERNGLRYGEVKYGDGNVNGENGTRFRLDKGDQYGFKNGLTNCVCAPASPIKIRQKPPKTREKRTILEILYIILNLLTIIPPRNLLLYKASPIYFKCLDPFLFNFFLFPSFKC
jgi:hypothetical protein